jgi:starch phosphorylase
VTVRALGRPQRLTSYGDKIRFEAAVNLDRLAPEDVEVELLMGSPLLAKQEPASYILKPMGREGDEEKYAIDLAPELCGKLEYRIRAYPRHPSLSHRFEMGLMKWA